ncbi:hypothetical protein HpMS107_40300 [Helicobacter pylori]
MGQPLAEPNSLQHVDGPLAHAIGLATQLERKHYVLQRGQMADQLERLKHEANVTPAQRGTLVFIEPEQILTMEPDRSRARQIEPGKQAK